jgi:MFS family permease
MSTMQEKEQSEQWENSDKTEAQAALATHIDSFVDNPELDRRLNRKFDIHILPWLFGIWLFSFIDRSNIGNARIAGLTTDLGIATGTSFNVALLVFYIPYILVDVPSNLLVKKFRAGVYLPSLITAWGIVCLCMGFITSFAGLIVCRLFLGLFEGGILGGVIIYLAMFYPRHAMMLRNGLFYCAAPLSGAFGGLLASGLAKIEVGGYNRWPWIFFSMLKWYTMQARSTGANTLAS